MSNWRFDLESAELLCFDGANRLRARVALDEVDPSAFFAEVRGESAKHVTDDQALGRKLFQWLIGLEDHGVPVREALGEGVILRVDIDCPLSDAPWELMHDGQEYSSGRLAPLFLPLRRAIKGAHTLPDPVNRPPRLLMLTFPANPPETQRGVPEDEPEEDPALQEEEGLVLEALAGVPLELQVEDSGCLAILNENLGELDSDYFELIHIRGRVIYHEGKACLLTEDPQGLRQYSHDSRIALALSPDFPRLFFICGLATGDDSERDALLSLAHDMVKQGVPAILTWWRPPGDHGMRTACAELYRSLAEGHSVAEAVAATRAVLAATGVPGWHDLHLLTDDTPMAPIVTPTHTANRLVFQPLQMPHRFAPAGSKAPISSAGAFVGRRCLIQKVLHLFRTIPGMPGYHECVVLHGPQGAGKSSLAARIRERMYQFREIVLVGPLSEAALIQGLNDALNHPRAAEIMDAVNRSMYDRFEMLLVQVMELEPFVVTFEDFEQNARRDEHGMPLLDDDGYLILEDEPATLFTRLLEAINTTVTETRVLVTSTHPVRVSYENAAIGQISIAALNSADVLKKLRQLPWLGSRRHPLATRARKALVLCEGLPGLLEAVDGLLKLLATPGSAEFTFEEAHTRLTAVPLWRRRLALFRFLLEQVDGEGLRLLGFLSLMRIPVSLGTVKALAGGALVDARLNRAIELGLVVLASGEMGSFDRYYLPDEVAELLPETLPETERNQALARAASDLFKESWDICNARQLAQAREAYRLALAANVPDLARDAGLSLAEALISRSRLREATAICQLILDAFGEERRLLRTLARAELALGDADAAAHHLRRARERVTEDPRPGDPVAQNLGDGSARTTATVDAEEDQALSYLEESLAEHEGDSRGETASHYSLGLILSNQGRDKEAGDHLREALNRAEALNDRSCQAAVHHELGLLAMKAENYREALSCFQRSLDTRLPEGDGKGRSATLLAMAGVYTELDEPSEAERCLGEALTLSHEAGDLVGEASALHTRAAILAERKEDAAALDHFKRAAAIFKQLGDMRRHAVALADAAWTLGLLGGENDAEGLFLRAVWTLAEERAWPELSRVLYYLGNTSDPMSDYYLAQSFWLSMRIQVPLKDFVLQGYSLMDRFGPDSEVSRQLCSAIPLMILFRSEEHPSHRELLNEAGLRILNFVGAENLTPDAFTLWIAGHGLENPNQVFESLNRALESVVPEEAWVFDRAYFRDFLWPEISAQGPG
ncbi:Tetratricopeptide repeat protein [Sulfidibacter corallicola]|uniref:Tetratricopeptide repeat protein n=1 Tax=Sulfidibacter corallicola TaxID=2818388 RepID=A0A8A4TLJ0_SULCO|nr:tetratricopeptide repeat protein [Sulfidibacter corallicola]QTD50859.1 tetratricopeptide repeat protein [Sulfidibacter corallicola]